MPRQPETREPEIVGGYKMTVVPGTDSPESRTRWEGRVGALAAWLLSEFEKERNGQGLDGGPPKSLKA